MNQTESSRKKSIENDASLEEKIALCNRWKASGLSKTQFCKKQGLTPAIFYRWCRRLCSEPDHNQQPVLMTPVRIIENEDKENHESTVVLELSLPNQASARLSLPLASLGRVIRELCNAATTLR